MLILGRKIVHNLVTKIYPKYSFVKSIPAPETAGHISALSKLDPRWARRQPYVRVQVEEQGML
jgi:hypothetical protein